VIRTLLETSFQLSLLLGLALGAAGCRHAHLGDGTGRAYQAALDAQRASAPADVPSFDADHARAVLAARRGKADGATAAAGGAPAIALPLSAPGSAGATGSWPGATGNITLEAR
jgi:hypothetical protein